MRMTGSHEDSNALALLARHPVERLSMHNAEVAVIGAGLAGLSTAIHLLRLGATDVIVLEREHVGSGSSSLSIGIVETQYIDAVDVHARAYGLRFFQELEQQHGLRFVHNGYLRVADDEAGMALFAKSVAMQARFGVEDAMVVSASVAGRLAAGLDTSTIAGGLWGPTDGFIDGYLACQILAEIVTSLGGTILQKAALLSAEHRDEMWRLQTDRGEVAAPTVVNAAGPWAAVVGDMLGAPVPLSPERHQAAVIELREPMTESFPCFIDYIPGRDSDSLSLRWENPSQLIACIHNEASKHPPQDPDSYDIRSDGGFIDQVVEKIALRFPDLEAGIGHTWAGLYPMTSDGQPVVGRQHDRPSVVCALGGGGNGVQLAPMIGLTAAESVLDLPITLTESAVWAASRVSIAQDAR